MTATALRLKPPFVNTPPATTASEEPEQLFLILKLPTREESIRKRVNNLVEQIHSSRLFDSEKVGTWVQEAAFDTTPLGSEEELRDAADKLCYLLCDIIRPAIAEAFGGREDEILGVEDQIREILKIALPDVDLNAYIEEFEKYSIEADEYQRQLDHVEEIAQEKLEEISLAAAVGDAALSERFNGHRAFILESIEEQKEAVNILHDAIDAVGNSVNLARDDLLGSANKMKKLGAGLEKAQQNVWRAAAAGRSVLAQVKGSVVRDT